MSPSATGQGSEFLGAGLTWSVSVALLAFLGHLLDGQIATSPWFLVIGAVLGAVGGFVHFVNLVAPDLLPFRRRRGRSSDSDSPPDSP